MHLSKPTECTASKVNPNGNSGLWVLVMCPCWSISCNKCATLVGDVNNERGYACVGAEAVWETLYLLLPIAVNLKLL